MPLLLMEEIDEQTSWALWEISESYEELFGGEFFSSEDELSLKTKKSRKKRMESMAGRLLVKYLSSHLGADFQDVGYDPHHKPLLKSSYYQISISHSFPLVAAIIHTQKSVGIDIEKVQKRLIRLAPKFLKADEINDAGEDSRKLCVYWSAKEVLYKIQGKKGVSLKENIRIRPFQLVDQKGIVAGSIIKDGTVRNFKVFYKYFKEYVICYSIY